MFKPVQDNANDSSHSSSIMDVFSAIYQEVDFMSELQWKNPEQNARLYKTFGQACLFFYSLDD